MKINVWYCVLRGYLFQTPLTPLPEKNSESSWGLRIFSLSHACDKTSSKLTISLISIYKHYAIDIANPSSMQDASHMNFEINLAHRGVSVAQW